MGSETLSSACYILSDESSIPLNSKSNGYKNVTEEKWKREDKPRAVLHVPYRKKPSAFVSLFVKKCVLELFFSKCVPEVLFGNASGCTMLKHIQTAPQSNICLKICSSVSFCVKKMRPRTIFCNKIPNLRVGKHWYVFKCFRFRHVSCQYIANFGGHIICYAFIWLLCQIFNPKTHVIFEV